MYHHLPVPNRAVSERLSSILDGVGYSREDRDRNVRDITVLEVFSGIRNTFLSTGCNMYVFGSRGEGSTGPGLNSDEDRLFQTNKLKPITDLSDCQPDKMYLHMLQDGHTHPGYVKLQKVRTLPDNTLVPAYNPYCVLDSNGLYVVPNTGFHDTVCDYVSGPADCFERGCISLDRVIALRCSQWPREGYEWFHRRRFYGWPTTHQIQNTWKYGCFATPVGHPSSNEVHLEWRLSFSIAERDLSRSFEDTVMKVYVLLKMIKKTCIEPIIKDAFSSYHCKVCMLWMRENTPTELWCTENLLYCLILCIRKLYEWASAGFCPDYFIVRNNIYDRKLVGMTRLKLIQILDYLLHDDCRFLCRIECCHIGHLLVKGMSSFDHCYSTITRDIFIEAIKSDGRYLASVSECRYTMLRTIPQYYPSLTYYLQRFTIAFTHARDVIQYPLKHILMILFSQLGFHLASVLMGNADLLSRENVEYLVAMTSECLSLGMNSDATSVRLKLCGLGINLENYDLTETCIQGICEKRMRYMWAISPDSKSPISCLRCNIESRYPKLLTQRYSNEDMLVNQVSSSVVYLFSEIPITPIPLRMEMFRSIGTSQGMRDEEEHFWYDWAVVDSLMCLYFFQYMNFSRQRKDRHKQVAMDNMVHVIRTEPEIAHKDTALNLLGHCYMQEKLPRNAFICFRESLKIRPHHNAAKFYMGLLFMKVLTTRIRPSMY